MLDLPGFILFISLILSRLLSRAESSTGFCPMTVEWRKAILGFTPVCTMAKELAVAKSFPTSLQSTEPPVSNLHYNWGMFHLGWSSPANVTSRNVRAESVCPIFHLRMFSDSGTISPGPGWPDWKLRNWEWELSCHELYPYNVMVWEELAAVGLI